MKARKRIVTRSSQAVTHRPQSAALKVNKHRRAFRVKAAATRSTRVRQSTQQADHGSTPPSPVKTRSRPSAKRKAAESPQESPTDPTTTASVSTKTTPRSAGQRAEATVESKVNRALKQLRIDFVDTHLPVDVDRGRRVSDRLGASGTTQGSGSNQITSATAARGRAKQDTVKRPDVSEDRTPHAARGKAKARSVSQTRRQQRDGESPSSSVRADSEQADREPPASSGRKRRAQPAQTTPQAGDHSQPAQTTPQVGGRNVDADIEAADSGKGMESVSGGPGAARGCGTKALTKSVPETLVTNRGRALKPRSLTPSSITELRGKKSSAVEQGPSPVANALSSTIQHQEADRRPGCGNHNSSPGASFRKKRIKMARSSSVDDLLQTGAQSHAKDSQQLMMGMGETSSVAGLDGQMLDRHQPGPSGPLQMSATPTGSVSGFFSSKGFYGSGKRKHDSVSGSAPHSRDSSPSVNKRIRMLQRLRDSSTKEIPDVLASHGRHSRGSLSSHSPVSSRENSPGMVHTQRGHKHLTDSGHDVGDDAGQEIDIDVEVSQDTEEGDLDEEEKNDRSSSKSLDHHVGTGGLGGSVARKERLPPLYTYSRVKQDKTGKLIPVKKPLPVRSKDVPLQQEETKSGLGTAVKGEEAQSEENAAGTVPARKQKLPSDLPSGSKEEKQDTTAATKAESARDLPKFYSPESYSRTNKSPFGTEPTFLTAHTRVYYQQTSPSEYTAMLLGPDGKPMTKASMGGCKKLIQPKKMESAVPTVGSPPDSKQQPSVEQLKQKGGREQGVSTAADTAEGNVPAGSEPSAAASPSLVKRGPGRPRKERPIVFTVKRRPGRPKRTDCESKVGQSVKGMPQFLTKRKPGRPRKRSTELSVPTLSPEQMLCGQSNNSSLTQLPMVKRSPGRPRVRPLLSATTQKLCPALTHSAAALLKVKRGPGRPKKLVLQTSQDSDQSPQQKGKEMVHAEQMHCGSVDGEQAQHSSVQSETGSLGGTDIGLTVQSESAVDQLPASEALPADGDDCGQTSVQQGGLLADPAEASGQERELGSKTAMRNLSAPLSPTLQKLRKIRRLKRRTVRRSRWASGRLPKQSLTALGKVPRTKALQEGAKLSGMDPQQQAEAVEDDESFESKLSFTARFTTECVQVKESVSVSATSVSVDNRDLEEGSTVAVTCSGAVTSCQTEHSTLPVTQNSANIANCTENTTLTVDRDSANTATCTKNTTLTVAQDSANTTTCADMNTEPAKSVSSHEPDVEKEPAELEDTGYGKLEEGVPYPVCKTVTETEQLTESPLLSVNDCGEEIVKCAEGDLLVTGTGICSDSPKPLESTPSPTSTVVETGEVSGHVSLTVVSTERPKQTESCVTASGTDTQGVPLTVTCSGQPSTELTDGLPVPISVAESAALGIISSLASVGSSEQVETVQTPAIGVDFTEQVAQPETTCTEQLEKVPVPLTSATERLEKVPGLPTSATERLEKVPGLPTSATERLEKVPGLPTSATERLEKVPGLPTSATERLEKVPGLPTSATEQVEKVLVSVAGATEHMESRVMVLTSTDSGGQGSNTQSVASTDLLESSSSAGRSESTDSAPVPVSAPGSGRETLPEAGVSVGSERETLPEAGISAGSERERLLEARMSIGAERETLPEAGMSVGSRRETLTEAGMSNGSERGTLPEAGMSVGSERQTLPEAGMSVNSDRETLPEAGKVVDTETAVPAVSSVLADDGRQQEQAGEQEQAKAAAETGAREEKAKRKVKIPRELKRLVIDDGRGGLTSRLAKSRMKDLTRKGFLLRSRHKEKDELVKWPTWEDLQARAGRKLKAKRPGKLYSVDPISETKLVFKSGASQSRDSARHGEGPADAHCVQPPDSEQLLQEAAHTDSDSLVPLQLDIEDGPPPDITDTNMGSVSPSEGLSPPPLIRPEDLFSGQYFASVSKNLPGKADSVTKKEYADYKPSVAAPSHTAQEDGDVSAPELVNLPAASASGPTEYHYLYSTDDLPPRSRRRPGRPPKGQRGRRKMGPASKTGRAPNIRPGPASSKPGRKSRAYKVDLSASDSLSPSLLEPRRFALRPKTTRSPIEIIAMRQKQEEEEYDLEEATRQARRLKRRQAHVARLSLQAAHSDSEAHESCQPCSVVLVDFVKKLQLDALDSSDQYVSDMSYDSADSEEEEENDAYGMTGSTSGRKHGREMSAPQTPRTLVSSTAAPLALSGAAPEVKKTVPDLESLRGKGFVGNFVDFLENRNRQQQQQQHVRTPPLRQRFSSNQSSCKTPTTSPSCTATIGKAEQGEAQQFALASVSSGSPGTSQVTKPADIQSTSQAGSTLSGRKPGDSQSGGETTDTTSGESERHVKSNQIKNQTPGLSRPEGAEVSPLKVHVSEAVCGKLKVFPAQDISVSARFLCKKCDFSSLAKQTMESHVYRHIPGVSFQCGYCDSEFSAMASVQTHVKSIHPKKEVRVWVSKDINEASLYTLEEPACESSSTQQHKSGLPGQAAIASQICEDPSVQETQPLIISLVVRGEVRPDCRPLGSSRRFVCTHCGYSTNINDDVKQHVKDLHRGCSLYCCYLCDSECGLCLSDIKTHCAIVHTDRPDAFKKLPDFYDQEQIRGGGNGERGKSEDRGNIFDRMSSLFQAPAAGMDGVEEGPLSLCTHYQRARDYMHILEGMSRKTMVEADSTTIGDIEVLPDDLSEPATAEVDSTVEERQSDESALAQAHVQTASRPDEEGGQEDEPSSSMNTTEDDMYAKATVPSSQQNGTSSTRCASVQNVEADKGLEARKTDSSNQFSAEKPTEVAVFAGSSPSGLQKDADNSTDNAAVCEGTEQRASSSKVLAGRLSAVTDAGQGKGSAEQVTESTKPDGVGVDETTRPVSASRENSKGVVQPVETPAGETLAANMSAASTCLVCVREPSTVVEQTAVAVDGAVHTKQVSNTGTGVDVEKNRRVSATGTTLAPPAPVHVDEDDEDILVIELDDEDAAVNDSLITNEEDSVEEPAAVEDAHMVPQNSSLSKPGAGGDAAIDAEEDSMGIQILEVVSLRDKANFPGDQSSPDQPSPQQSLPDKSPPVCDATQPQTSQSKISPSRSGGEPLGKRSPADQSLPEVDADEIAARNERLVCTYKCHKCNVHSPALSAIVEHLKQYHHNVPLFSCPYCKLRKGAFFSEEEVHLHVKDSHPNNFAKNEVSLSEVAKSFVQVLAIPSGRNSSGGLTEQDVYMCLKCENHVPDLDYAFKHLQLEHRGLIKYACPTCKTFRHASQEVVQTHMLREHSQTADCAQLSLAIEDNFFTRVTSISTGGVYRDHTPGTLPAGKKDLTVSPTDGEKTNRASSGAANSLSVSTPGAAASSPSPVSKKSAGSSVHSATTTSRKVTTSTAASGNRQSIVSITSSHRQTVASVTGSLSTPPVVSLVSVPVGRDNTPLFTAPPTPIALFLGPPLSGFPVPLQPASVGLPVSTGPLSPPPPALRKSPGSAAPVAVAASLSGPHATILSPSSALTQSRPILPQPPRTRAESAGSGQGVEGMGTSPSKDWKTAMTVKDILKHRKTVGEGWEQAGSVGDGRHGDTGTANTPLSVITTSVTPTAVAGSPSPRRMFSMTDRLDRLGHARTHRSVSPSGMQPHPASTATHTPPPPSTIASANRPVLNVPSVTTVRGVASGRAAAVSVDAGTGVNTLKDVGGSKKPPGAHAMSHTVAGTVSAHRSHTLVSTSSASAVDVEDPDAYKIFNLKPRLVSSKQSSSPLVQKSPIAVSAASPSASAQTVPPPVSVAMASSALFPQQFRVQAAPQLQPPLNLTSASVALGVGGSQPQVLMTPQGPVLLPNLTFLPQLSTLGPAPAHQQPAKTSPHISTGLALAAHQQPVKTSPHISTDLALAQQAAILNTGRMAAAVQEAAGRLVGQHTAPSTSKLTGQPGRPQADRSQPAPAALSPRPPTQRTPVLPPPPQHLQQRYRTPSPALASRPNSHGSSHNCLCPYCPTPMTLKRWEVSSHIRTAHPGQKIVYEKV